MWVSELCVVCFASLPLRYRSQARYAPLAKQTTQLLVRVMGVVKSPSSMGNSLKTFNLCKHKIEKLSAPAARLLFQNSVKIIAPNLIRSVFISVELPFIDGVIANAVKASLRLKMSEILLIVLLRNIADFARNLRYQ